MKETTSRTQQIDVRSNQQKLRIPIYSMHTSVKRVRPASPHYAISVAPSRFDE